MEAQAQAQAAEYLARRRKRKYMYIADLSSESDDYDDDEYPYIMVPGGRNPRRQFQVPRSYTRLLRDDGFNTGFLAAREFKNVLSDLAPDVENRRILTLAGMVRDMSEALHDAHPVSITTNLWGCPEVYLQKYFSNEGFQETITGNKNLPCRRSTIIAMLNARTYMENTCLFNPRKDYNYKNSEIALNSHSLAALSVNMLLALAHLPNAQYGPRGAQDGLRKHLTGFDFKYQLRFFAPDDDSTRASKRALEAVPRMLETYNFNGNYRCAAVLTYSVDDSRYSVVVARDNHLDTWTVIDTNRRREFGAHVYHAHRADQIVPELTYIINGTTDWNLQILRTD